MRRRQPTGSCAPWLALALLGAACQSGERPSTIRWDRGGDAPPPDRVPRDPRDLAAVAPPVEPWGAPQPRWRRPGPLRVVHHGPRGTLHRAEPIRVVFDRPMVALGPTAPTRPVPPPLRVEPDLRLRIRWSDPRTLLAEPAAEWPLATRFTITLAKGLRALDGTALARPLRWSAESARPACEEVEPRSLEDEHHERIRRTAAFSIRLTQVPALPQARRAIRLLANGRPHPFRVTPSLEPHDAQKRLIVTPIRPYPLGARIRVEVTPGLRSVHGPLGLVKGCHASGRVHAPLEATVRCGGKLLGQDGTCGPMADGEPLGLSVRFTEPICASDLRRALRLEPSTVGAPSFQPEEESRVSGGDDPCAREWRPSRDLRPHGRYRLTVAPPLKDVFGTPLERRRQVSFRTTGFPPGLFLPSQWHHRWSAGLPAVLGPGKRYPLRAMNLQTLEIQRQPLAAEALARLIYCRPLNEELWPARCAPPSPSSRQRLTLPTRRDRLQPQALPVTAGTTLLELSSPEVLDAKGRRVRWRRLIPRADFDLWAYQSPFGLLVRAHHWKDGAPVGGARLTVLDAKGLVRWRGRTDAGGLARISAEALGAAGARRVPSLLVVAEQGSEQAWVAPSLRRPALRTDQRPAWRSLAPTHQVHLDADRRHYRPGETLYYHGAVHRWRLARREPLPGPIRLQMTDARGTVLAERVIPLQARGVFHGALHLPPRAALGGARLRLTLGGRDLATHDVSLVELQPPAFAVQLSVSPQEVRGQAPVRIALGAQHLHDAPLAGRSYRLRSRTRCLARIDPEGFLIGDEARPRRSEVALLQGRLDAQGRAEHRVPAWRLGDVAGPVPCRVTLEATVTSLRQKQVSARRAVDWSPGDLLPGVKPLDESGARIGRLLRLVTPKGVPQAGRLRVFIDTAAGRLAAYEVSVPREGLPHWLRLPPGRAGQALEVEYRATDGRGRVAVTRERITVPGKGPTSPAPRPKRPTATLTITTDKPEYLPGEVATITVRRRGLAAQAALIVARERIFAAHALRFDGAGQATIRFPVRTEHAGALELLVSAIRPDRLTARPEERRVAASATLRVSRRPFALRVGLRPRPAVARPGDRVSVEIQVKDGLHRPRRASVVVMAVDEAWLQLDTFGRPSPRRTLWYEPRFDVVGDALFLRLGLAPITVRHVDWRRTNGETGGGVGIGGGGYGLGHYDARREPVVARDRFQVTPWHALVTTDASGRAWASFTLPHDLTRYRLYAFAVGDDRAAGSGEASLQVTAPLLLTPAMPPFLRVGDRAELGAVVQHRGTGRQQVRVQLALEGPTGLLRSSAPLLQTVTLGPWESRRVGFSVSALGAGTLRLRFTATGPRGADAVIAPLHIRRPSVLQSTAVAGRTTDAVRHRLGPLGAVDPSAGGLTVHLGAGPQVMAFAASDYLRADTYACLEQTASRALALALHLLHGPGAPATRREARRALRTTLASLAALQRPDGGFAFWPGATDAHAWGTAWATFVTGVLDGHRRALDVDGRWPDLLAARRHLARRLHPKPPAPLLSGEARALTLLALARDGRRGHAETLTMARQLRDGSMASRALILASLATAPPSPAAASARRQLLRELRQALRIEGSQAYAREHWGAGFDSVMGSDARTTAMILYALTLTQPDDPLIPRLLEYLMRGRPRLVPRHTQEAAWTLLALDAVRARERGRPRFTAGAWLGARWLGGSRWPPQDGTAPRPLLLPMAELLRASKPGIAPDLVVGRRGTGALYYLARLRWAKLGLPHASEEHGFRLRRHLEALGPDRRPVTPARPPRLGEEALVTLDLWAPDHRQHVALEDPVPAGLEVLHTELAVARRLQVPGALQGEWADHTERRFDRVRFFRDELSPGRYRFRYLVRATMPGRFLHPPAQVHERYRPEVRALTGSTWCEVR